MYNGKQKLDSCLEKTKRKILSVKKKIENEKKKDEFLKKALFYLITK